MNINEDTGRILWSQESKYYLVRLVKENIVIVNPDVSAETMAKKELAWKAIEENFAADGMPCQLGKLKRLWKRMKDTARTNIMKFNEQKRRGSKVLKPPTELDLLVADMLASRNLLKKKPKSNRRYNSGGTVSRPQIEKVNVKREPSESRSLDEEYFRNDYESNPIDDDDDDDDPQQHLDDEQMCDNNLLLEPMTIIDEAIHYKPSSIAAASSAKTNGYSNCNDQDDDDMDDDDDVIQIPSNFKLTNHLSGFNKKKTQNTATISPIVTKSSSQQRDEFLAAELKLKQTQIRNEVEKMNLDRELYRKKLILIDLQIKQTRLDILSKSNSQ